ncbi:MAG TPA: polysaccharide deacetylase family protein [Segetibacter sp.]
MQVLVYTSKASPRVTYIFSTLLYATGFKNYHFTNDLYYFRNYPEPKINYSLTRITEGEIWISPVPLLFEAGIKLQEIHCFNLPHTPYFFKINSDLPFDIFAASFYLLTRYEEYLPHEKDMYGRYAHENSIAFQQNFLHLPAINVWLDELKKLIVKKYPSITLKPNNFRFIPTYDIDIAWSYKQKGWLRNAGGLLKSISKGQLRAAKQRIAVLAGKERDPFDSYEWLDGLHKEYNLSPVYFFLLAQKNKGYDKNILPTRTPFKQLIINLNTKYKTGIHPSWQSGDDEAILLKEIQILEEITKAKVERSRQHYIRMSLPDTYRKLIEAGIKEDYSMGYGSINGFRASYCLPYKWYDLEKEQVTDLIIFPFCYMDANSYFEQKFSSEKALQEMRDYYTVVKQVNGYFITIWHNHFLGTDNMFTGWREVYETFTKQISQD